MLIIGGLHISAKSPLEINRKIPTTRDSLTVHPDEIEGALLLAPVLLGLHTLFQFQQAPLTLKLESSGNLKRRGRV
jgi:hypothetical protein